MGWWAFILLGLLAAALLLTSSEVGARDLAETSTEKKNAELSTKTDDTTLEYPPSGYDSYPAPGDGSYPTGPIGYGSPPTGPIGYGSPPTGPIGYGSPPTGPIGYGYTPPRGYVPPRGGYVPPRGG